MKKVLNGTKSYAMNKQPTPQVTAKDKDGLTLLVDKPLNWTSFDVVNKLRYCAKKATGRKKIKVGHAGTLDPLATGLLIICIGSHTKKMADYTGLDKRYEGMFRLGATTPSYDLETDIDQTFDLPSLNPAELEAAAIKFEGAIDQVPPPFSAKKLRGQKAYDLARRGRKPELKAVRVRINSFKIDAGEFPDVRFTLHCSKGTYVRSLVHNYGAAIGCGAHLTALRRTAIGPFNIDDALSIDQAMAQIEAHFLNSIIDS